MTRAFVSRLLLVPPLLFVVFTIVFFVLRLAPGGPFDAQRDLPPEIRRAVERRYGLDAPLLRQYLREAKRVFTEFDLGPSLSYRDRSVNEVLAETLPRSASLGSMALLLALGLGVPLGALSAFRRGRPVGRGLTLAFAALLSVPNFVLATVLVLIFSVELRWLPVAGFDSPAHLLLPALALSLPITGAVARIVRSGVIEALDAPFVRTAKAKGLPERRIVWGHVIRAGLVPLCAWLGPASAALLTGSLVVEKIFAIPGMGTFFVQSVLNRDYTLASGVLLVYFAIVALLNALADAAVVLLDPRAEGPR